MWPVECWSTPLQWWSEVASWQELKHAMVYADPEHIKHVQWVTSLVSLLAMYKQEGFRLSEIVYRYLQHEAAHYHAATWDDFHRCMALQYLFEVCPPSNKKISAKKKVSFVCAAKNINCAILFFEIITQYLYCRSFKISQTIK